MGGRILSRFGVFAGIALMSACGSTPGPTPPPTSAPTSTASFTPGPNGSLTLTGQLNSVASVNAQLPCNQAGGWALEDPAHDIFQFSLINATPGTEDISSPSAPVSVSLQVVTASGTRINWSGGSGTGNGAVTAPATAGSLTDNPGSWSVNVDLPPVSGQTGISHEQIKGTWLCS